LSTKEKHYTTKQVADTAGIDKSTLLRWIRQGKVSDSRHRDGRGWRMWTQEEVEEIIIFNENQRNRCQV